MLTWLAHCTGGQTANATRLMSGGVDQTASRWEFLGNRGKTCHEITGNRHVQARGLQAGSVRVEPGEGRRAW